MDDHSALDELDKKLDSRNGERGRVRRSGLSPKSSSTKSGWFSKIKKRPRKRTVGLLEVGFIGSLVFFVVALVFAAFLFFSGNNTVSTRNVSITIDGPTEIRAGDPLQLQVAVTNRNSVPMELTDLVIEFPAGTRSETDISVELPRLRESLGSIQPGESVNKTIRAVVFGSSNTDVEIKATVEYRVPSSNAIFYGEQTYTLPISQSPASISIDALKEIISGQETTLTVTVTSNIQDVLDNMLLVADYPPGFSFTSASPSPFAGSSVWRLGDIEPGGERTITIRGSFTGEDGDDRVTKFTTGSEKEGIEGELAAPLAAGDTTVTLAKPFVSASLALNGNTTTEYVAERGDAIRGDIRWTNNLPTRVQDVEIVVSLDGAIIDKNSVSADRGFYRSSNNTISWNKETDPKLADLAPGESGVSTFSISSLPLGQGTFRNPEIKLFVTVSARRITEANVPERVESSAESTVLIGSDLTLQPTLSSAGGPIPPTADQETSYNVSWVVSNNANALANTSVSAVLPGYVEWKGSSNPNVSFNSIGGIVTWDIGDLGAGEARTATFQIGFTPSVSQVGSAPTLVSDQRVYGFDRFTRTQIERALKALTSKSNTSQQNGVVVP